MSVFDKSKKFEKSFKKRYQKLFFDNTQENIKMFCKDFLGTKFDEMTFQSKEESAFEQDTFHQGSTLSTKHAIIKKKTRKSDNVSKMSLDNASSISGLSPSKPIVYASFGKFETFKKKFLDYVTNEVESTYNLKNLKIIFNELSSKCSTFLGESVVMNFSSKCDSIQLIQRH
jgi:hypothetical protein